MHYFHIAHYTSCLLPPPPSLPTITVVSGTSPGHSSHLKKIEDNVSEKYLGVNNVYYGL